MNKEIGNRGTVDEIRSPPFKSQRNDIHDVQVRPSLPAASEVKDGVIALHKGNL